MRNKSKKSFQKTKDNKLINNKNPKIAKSMTLKNLTHKEVPQKSWNSKIKNNSKIIATQLSEVKEENANSNTSDYLGVRALIAIMEPVTESQEFNRKKLPLKSHPRNKKGPSRLRVRWRPLFPTKRNRQTLSLLEKAAAKVWAYFKWELPN